MMSIPAHVTTRWMATLGDEQLVAAEAQLYADFHAREVKEKSRSGSRYILLQGPAALVNAWRHWLLVNNEVRERGVLVRHAR